jgi:hypothetical protein
MTEEKIREILVTAMRLRFPRMDPNSHPTEKIAKLESYLTDTAVYRGDLEEARYWAREAEKVLEDQWDAIQGWEAIRDKKRDTDQAVADAKRKLKPDLYRGLRDVRRLLHDIDRQIKRLEKDYDALSRDYTVLTGS